MNAEWLLKRNCSLSPRQAAKAYGALCGALLLIGLVFTLRGAWWVLTFALVEIGATVLACCTLRAMPGTASGFRCQANAS